MKTVGERIQIIESLKDASLSELKLRLTKSLKDRSPTVRGLAVEVIGEKQIDQMLPDVLLMLNDSSAEVRALAVESIGKFADRGGHVSTIAKYLRDPNELVRVSAAEVLGEIGSSKSLDDLEGALQEDSALVRSYVAEAIGAIGRKRSIPVLEKHLEIEKDDGAKLGFYVGLSLLDGRNVLQNLIDLFESDDYRVRCAVCNTLDQISIEGKDTEKVYSFLKDSLKREKTVAVRSSIETALKKGTVLDL